MENPILTIAMANYDDCSGFWMTASAIRMYHVPITNSQVEILVVDDMVKPQETLQKMAAQTKSRYHHAGLNKGPAQAKDECWRQAKGEYVLLIDSHVFLAPNSINFILNAIKNNQIGQDLWTGPLLTEAQTISANCLLPELRGNFFGIWSVDQKVAPGKKIEIYGHGSAYTLMKKAHYPYFSKNFRGFAGEEIYIHEKVRRNGGKCYCLHELGWQHRFYREKPITYRCTNEDKYWNYLVAFYEMNWSTIQIRDYFRRKLPANLATKIETEAIRLFPDIFSRPDVPHFKEHD